MVQLGEDKPRRNRSPRGSQALTCLTRRDKKAGFSGVPLRTSQLGKDAEVGVRGLEEVGGLLVCFSGREEAGKQDQGESVD